MNRGSSDTATQRHSDTATQPRRRSGGGFVLLAVLVVVAVAALAGSTAMYFADAQLESTRAALGRTRARSLAWSGVQAAMAELAEQRHDLLRGSDPALTRQWELFGGAGEVRGVVRLLAFDDDAIGPEVESEAAKLDLNWASVESLAALEGVGEGLAARIAEAREARAFTAPEELLGVPGVTEELFYGPAGGGVAALRDVLTVFSFDPNVQAGWGDRASEHRGRARIGVSGEWSEAMGAAIEERFDRSIAEAVRGLLEGGTRFTRTGDMVAVMRRLGAPPVDWCEPLDALTTTDARFVRGRIDLMRASAAVLGTVPGIGADAAERIVAFRVRLDEQTRSSPAWLAADGLLSAEEFELAVDHFTPRSLQWRVRIEAGFVPASDSMGWEDDPDRPLADAVRLEAVIDVASERPRIAYLRDITLLDLARRERARTSGGSPEPEEEDRTVVPPTAEPTAPGDSTPAPASRRSGLASRGDLDLGAMDLRIRDGGGGRAHEPAENVNEEDAPAPEEADGRIGRWTVGRGGPER